nr:unnamed protein product [Digitaria exilis]
MSSIVGLLHLSSMQDKEILTISSACRGLNCPCNLPSTKGTTFPVSTTCLSNRAICGISSRSPPAVVWSETLLPITISSSTMPAHSGAMYPVVPLM